MNCCHLQSLEDLFDTATAESELADYHRRGPSKTTRMLAQALAAAGVQGETLLDIGGGIGALQYALFDEGIVSAVDVDASRSYLSVAQSEAARRGLAGRVRHVHANFAALAEDVPEAGIVTLDRVLCCYPDYEALLRQSAARARRLCGLVYPRDYTLTRLGVWLLNQGFRLRKSHFRTFVHPANHVDALLRSYGFARRFAWSGLIWQVLVYQRA